MYIILFINIVFIFSHLIFLPTMNGTCLILI